MSNGFRSVEITMALQQPLPAHSYIDAQWDAHLARTRDFLRQPSISAQAIGLRETADCLRAWLEERGAAVSYFGAETSPIVYAHWDVGAPRTLLVYGMYDVQPVDGQTWTTPPFAAQIWDHPAGGESIVARGACNSKGPLMAFLHAVEALRATSGLPVNIKWTIEGDEEMGSHQLPSFYREQRARLAADAAFEPFWSQRALTAPPMITLGTKGVIGLEFTCRAGEWGGPRREVHSSLGNWIGNPAWRLIQALHTLVDQHQNLAVDGLPRLADISPDDERLLARQAERFDADAVLAHYATARFKQTLPPRELLRELAFAPVLNINGLQSGYQGEGSHTILPTQARALTDLRLPPGFAVDETLDAIRRHLDRRGFGDIEIFIDAGYPGARTPFSAPVIQAQIAAYRAHGFEPEVRPVEASATPYYLFTDVLGLNFAWGGLGTAGGSHGPDEWCSVAGLRALEESTCTFLTAFADSPNAL
jgi:acetylornithine deacetylase/succinyl-diaminopimelate desuccinylase-like protein